ncbi:MAG: twin-arginine translocase TatA/TatE family subunit [Candidatus Kapaibacterium sp.]|jgi:TatA/E family protein of Tat protein translocase|nr:twin-arginine translocase TatA/TatE family subunit [Candidatus Kapabacteria bacterium]
MFDVGGGELVFIILAILVLFGPKKLPEFAKMIKRGMSEVKKAQSSFTEQITDVTGEFNKQTNSIKNKVEKDLNLKNDQINLN